MKTKTNGKTGVAVLIPDNMGVKTRFAGRAPRTLAEHTGLSFDPATPRHVATSQCPEAASSLTRPSRSSWGK